jgi:SAM-dependent methyltransferase
MTIDVNAVTLRSYDAHVAEFVAGTPKNMIGDTKTWIDSSLRMLPRSARILELGSGFGRDAAYMQAKGYTVECTDGAPGFVKLLNAQRQPARLLNISSDDLGSDQYDLIFANAVLEHFPRSELNRILAKTHCALRPSGLLSLSVREGTGEQWSNDKLGAPRYFCYWEADALRAYLDYAHFDLLSIKSSKGFKEIRRLYLIAKKTDIIQ